MRTRLVVVSALLALGVAAVAQERNPRGTATATIAGKEITIDYGRPALKGRSIEDLTTQLPADRIWRAGENQVTTLTTEGNLMIGGKKVPAGKYSLYVHAPETGEWSLVVNKDTGIALGRIWDKAPASLKEEPWPHLEGYGNISAQEVVRASMKSGSVPKAVEDFTIALAPAGEGATMSLSWGDRSWSLPIQPAK